MKDLAKVMIIVGIVLLMIPAIGSVYTKYQQNKMYETYLERSNQLEVMNEVLESGLTQSELIAGGEGGLDQSLPSAQTPNGIEVIGLIAIPKIDIEIMLVEGVTNQALKYAAGHMPGTALPGEVGNCSIAGHRSYTFGEYFNRLDELEEGDEIRITYGTEVYTYEVYESFLVEPTEISVIEPQGDEAIVTLITCHPVINPTHRLIVRGKLVED